MTSTGASTAFLVGLEGADAFLGLAGALVFLGLVDIQKILEHKFLEMALLTVADEKMSRDGARI